MKIIIAPDKFKGSLSTFEVCHAIRDGIQEADDSTEVFLFPMADGGDGFAAVMKFYLHTHTVECGTVDPLRQNIRASYEWNSETKTAIIEMAVASGLVLLKDQERNPLKTSTYGTGLLIRDAIQRGAQRIVLGLGGSATNDAGTGILSALGFLFKGSDDRLLDASGENLLQIEKIIVPSEIPQIKFEIACDVQNVLYGASGAAYVYAAQKGADDDAIRLLDDGLRHFAEIVNWQTGRDVSSVPGTGAAGGIAAGLMAFFDVQLKKGIDLVIESSTIKNKIEAANLLITGEGKIDEQTLQGKVVSELSRLARMDDIPVVAFCGTSTASAQMIEKLGVEYLECLVSASTTVEQAMVHAKDLLAAKAREFFKGYFLNKSH
jgi:glycerate kinase